MGINLLFLIFNSILTMRLLVNMM